MFDDGLISQPDIRGRLRRALSLSVVFPALAWFFADWFGLAIGLGAVAFWWLAMRPRRIIWVLAVLALAAAPVALWLQGLPRTSVVGATFGTDHWIANKLVMASLLLAAFAGLTELLRLDFDRPGPESVSRRLARKLLARTRRRLGGADQPPADPLA
ncbi:MAG: hypothetical protein ACRDHO_15445 [Actinomycetota bacterium]